MEQKENKESKPIRKTKDDAKSCIQDILSGDNTQGFDIDSLYCLNGEYFVLEFLFCESYPVEKSHPQKYYWNWKKFDSLLKVAKALDGRIFLINYEISHSNFKLMELIQVKENQIVTQDDRVVDRDLFQKWFRSLNNHTFIEIKDLK